MCIRVKTLEIQCCSRPRRHLLMLLNDLSQDFLDPGLPERFSVLQCPLRRPQNANPQPVAFDSVASDRFRISQETNRPASALVLTFTNGTSARTLQPAARQGSAAVSTDEVFHEITTRESREEVVDHWEKLQLLRHEKASC